jgi:lipopolysaccharide export system protein LptA
VKRGIYFSILLALLPPVALAEKADKTKPTKIESARMSADDTRRLTTFEGDVALVKGTVLVCADRIVVRQDADGFQFATATGKPVRFRQKGDPKDGREGVWTDGEAMRVELDDRNEKVELFDKARITRDKDEVRGEHISYDQRTEFFSVGSARPGAQAAPGSSGRVTTVLHPKIKPEAQAPAASSSAPPFASCSK